MVRGLDRFKLLTQAGHAWEVAMLGRWRHRRLAGNRVLVYYNQPRRFSDFLVLKYVASQRDTRYATLRRALARLDAIARLTGSDGLLCDVANARVSQRLMARGGQVHCPSRWHRHYINGFYVGLPSRPKL